MQDIPSINVCVERDVEFRKANSSNVGLQTYYNKETDTLYFEHPRSSSLFPVKLAIKHLVKPVTHLYATRLFYKFAPRFARVYNLKRMIRMIIALKLLQENYTLVHAGCVDLDGHGVLVAAFGDTGKTMSTLKLCFGNDYRFLSDDMTLIDNQGICLSYPESLTITPRTLNNTGIRLPTKDRIKSKFIGSLYRIHPTALFNANIKVPITTILPPKKVIKKTKGQTIVFLEKGSDLISEINKDDAVAKLLSITQKEIEWYSNPLVRYYSYFNCGFDVKNLIGVQIKIINQAVNNAENCYILRSRARHPEQINEVIRK